MVASGGCLYSHVIEGGLPIFLVISIECSMMVHITGPRKGKAGYNYQRAARFSFLYLLGISHSDKTRVSFAPQLQPPLFIDMICIDDLVDLHPQFPRIFSWRDSAG